MDLATLTKIFSEKGTVNVSDLHLISGEPPLYRIDGELTRSDKFPALSSKEIMQLLTPYLSSHNMDTFTKKGEVDFAGVVGKNRFRFNLFRSLHGVCCAMRNIPTEIPEMRALNIPPIMYDILGRRDGLILITGPTGSGKSTSMASMINHLNKTFPMHILTIEDPVEYMFNNEKAVIDQREVGAHTSSFSNALRAALREDVDAIIIGELRDTETIQLALTAAETGHLVIGTLHTASAAETIDRIVDIFPGEEKEMVSKMLASTLKATIAQRLLKRSGGGRVAAFEIMYNNSAISNLIRKKETHQIPSVIQTSNKSGMFTMADYVERLRMDNKITEEVYKEFHRAYGDIRKMNQ